MAIVLGFSAAARDASVKTDRGNTRTVVPSYQGHRNGARGLVINVWQGLTDDTVMLTGGHSTDAGVSNVQKSVTIAGDDTATTLSIDMRTPTGGVAVQDTWRRLPIVSCR